MAKRIARTATPLSVAMVGSQFMGRAHSNAWSQANKFFNLPRPVHQHTVFARDPEATADFAQRWGWSHHVSGSGSFDQITSNPDIALVDLATPNHVHMEHAIAAIEAGKHVTCEKPLAGTLDEARQMMQAAKKAKRRKVQTFVWFNYRRCPAIALAHRMVQAGTLGKIYHVRASYLQDWGGPDTPLLWRFQSKFAGSGAHGDLNAHIVDLARFITGDSIVEVTGAVAKTFVTKREIISDTAGTKPRRGAKKKFGKSTVDDCTLFLAQFKSGTVASFEATRLATGNMNRNRIEINGEYGSLRFDLERMNELEYFDASDSSNAATQGWTNIMCTNADAHPYVHAWWPDAHIIGYEHTFVNQAADCVNAIAGNTPEVPLPDFADAFETQLVLEAAMVSARERCAIAIKELR